MSEWVQLCGYFAMVFACSVGASYLLTSLRLRQRIHPPVPDSTLQVRSGTSIYRSKFLRENEMGWVISSPLARDAYVPLRVGEKLTVWAPTSKGLKQFETELVLRDGETHEMILLRPQRMQHVERRQSLRRCDFADAQVVFEGQCARLIDLSEGGAKIFARCVIKRGERVKLELPNLGEVFGWTLESSPRAQGCEIRVRFEEAVTL